MTEVKAKAKAKTYPGGPRRMPDRRVMDGEVYRYSFHATRTDGKPYMPITEEHMQPYLCPHGIKEFMVAAPRGRKIPIAYLQCTKQHLLDADTYYSAKMMYSAVTPTQLFRLHDWLTPARRNLCAMVQPDHDVHLYFDFDWDDDKINPKTKKRAPFHEAMDIEPIRRALLRMVRRCYVETFGEEPNLSDIHYEQACDAAKGKLSLHVHCASEAWRSVSDLDQWIKRKFIPFLDRHARKGDADALMLGEVQPIVDDDGNVKGDKFISGVDPGVYTKHRIFRFAGHCKPGGKHLEQYFPAVRPSLPPCVANLAEGALEPGSKKLNEHELLFAGLINYHILATAKRRTFGGGGSGSAPIKSVRKTQASTSTGASAGAGAGAGAGSGAKSASTSGGTEGVYFGDPCEWMSRTPIPWFTDRGLPQPEVEASGRHGNGQGDFYVRYKRYGSTACHHCSDEKGPTSIICHQNNYSYMDWTPGALTMRFHSYNPKCMANVYHVPVPAEAEGTVLNAVAQYTRDKEALDAKYGAGPFYPLPRVEYESSLPALEDTRLTTEMEYEHALGKRPRGGDDDDDTEDRGAPYKRARSFNSTEFHIHEAWMKRHAPPVAAVKKES